MRILFTHPKPARISYKHMRALKDAGHEVYLLCGKLSDDVLPSDINYFCDDYRPVLPLTKFPYYYKTYTGKIRSIVKELEPDIIQTYSEPDDVAVATIEAETGVPVVFCNRDNVTAYTKDLLASRVVPKYIAYNKYLGYLPREILYNYLHKLERIAHEKSNGRMYISPGMLEYSSKKYDISMHNLVVTEWVLDSELCKKKVEKLSSKDGNIHIGFTGAIVIRDDYRNHLSFLSALAKDNIHVHIHSIYHDDMSKYVTRTTCKTNPNLHLHDKLLPANEFVESLASYDWGIIPFEHQIRYVDTLLTNKIYDYISAGIPIISSNTKTLAKFLSKHKLGFVYSNLDDLTEKLKIEKPSSYKVDFKKFLLSKGVKRMIKFYEGFI